MNRFLAQSLPLPDSQFNVAGKKTSVMAIALLLAGTLAGKADAQDFPPVNNLGGLSGDDGFRLDGTAVGDLSGASVSNAGDINGDGFDDFIIGARGASVGGNAETGSSFVVFGQAGGFPASIDLATLDGVNGFRLDGEAGGHQAGMSVSAAGDVNDDGIADIIIGAPHADPGGRVDAGSSYVVFGRTTGFPPVIALGSLDGSDGFRLDGAEAGDNAGRSVSAAGDVNGDGVDDLIIGAYQASPGGNFSAGSAFVVFGRSGVFPAALDLGTLDGTNGFRLDGVAPGDITGTSVDTAGDVNGDGIDDVIVGAPAADPGGVSSAGSAYVVFGRDTGFPAVIGLGSLDGSNGFRIDGAEVLDTVGSTVARAGDINADGIADVIVGAPNSGPGGAFRAGSAFVVFGRTTGFPAVVPVATLTGSDGFRIDGAAPFNFAGTAVAHAGDINGDGIDDVLIGASGANFTAGSTYVLFGSSSGFPALVELSTLPGTGGIRFDGATAFEASAVSLSAAGDVNGDGLDDLIIGAFNANPLGRNNAGSSYVVFGREAIRDLEPVIVPTLGLYGLAGLAALLALIGAGGRLRSRGSRWTRPRDGAGAD